jgi:hypothetical protein
VRRSDNLTTFMCRLSRNLGASTFWNPKGLSRPVVGLLYHFFFPEDYYLKPEDGSKNLLRNVGRYSVFLQLIRPLKQRPQATSKRRQLQINMADHSIKPLCLITVIYSVFLSVRNPVALSVGHIIEYSRILKLWLMSLRHKIEFLFPRAKYFSCKMFY